MYIFVNTLNYNDSNNIFLYVYTNIKEVDLALGPFAIEIKRHEVMEFAGFLGGAGSSILVRYPSIIYTSPFATLEPLSYQVITT